MLNAVRPNMFVPVHGEYQHLVKHGRLAEECGVRKDNVILLEDGQPLTLLEDSFRLEQRVPVECTLVDGKGVGDVGYAVLKERRILGDEGMPKKPGRGMSLTPRGPPVTLDQFCSVRRTISPKPSVTMAR